MFLSYLLIDTGSNPDRPRPGRKWITNVYNIHRRLSMAFPKYETLLEDPNCLMPFSADKLEQRPFLFRLDNNLSPDGQRAMIIVLSSLKPNWEWCFHNAKDFLAAPPNTKEYNPVFAVGEKLRFRIKMNLSYKSATFKSNSLSHDGKNSKRLALTWEKDSNPEDAVNAWFAVKAEKNGFRLCDSKLIQLSWVFGSKIKSNNASDESSQSHNMRFRSALLEGYLEITDALLFQQAVCNGIGSAKSMGFGLLSVLKG